ncbi:hypothetical protein KIPB_003971 [Kipferlia bialata]|uniref:Uncharacterized protein n=1 Tax=Kipferlia bialata TaxID=797122 RepID=A0A9K3CW98_9EUKA|nr:hypothetical protein KIPB_003971 [Kipferlia bialata]|eukprot:g3971.t1
MSHCPPLSIHSPMGQGSSSMEGEAPPKKPLTPLDLHTLTPARSERNEFQVSEAELTAEMVSVHEFATNSALMASICEQTTLLAFKHVFSRGDMLSNSQMRPRHRRRVRRAVGAIGYTRMCVEQALSASDGK